MERPNKDERTVKTFNTAKEYAENILFPLMFDYKKFQRMANFGSDNLINAVESSEEYREIQRYNGLKAMAETTDDLLRAISSTVIFKGNSIEIKKLNELLTYLEKVRETFYKHKEKFFNSVFKDGKATEVLDRDYFNKIKDIIEACYINTEILMTRNKLLFADANDEYMADDEVKEAIRREYIEN